MAGDKAAASRMQVRLTAGSEQYDQVIALSQGNINESLKYHFRTNKELLNFDVEIEEPIQGQLKGKIKPPTIELVDAEGADQGIYYIEFGPKSTFTSTTVGKDPVTKKTKLVETNLSASGWKIAFYVDFSLKAMSRVGENVKKDIEKLVNNPGVYSVEQLLINFGTADLMTFNWSRSRITGLNTQVSEATIKQFMNKWLENVRQSPDPVQHQVIGYAVKAKDPNAAAPSAPTLPPTSVRLQTIAYRDANTKPDPDHDFNAFLFTEMTENRKMITKDLDWSGNFFYESIGGTLVMSRHLFIDRYVAPKLEIINRLSLRAGFQISDDLLSMKIFSFKSWAEQQSIAWEKSGNELTYNKYFPIKQEQSDWEMTVSNTFKVLPRTNKFQVERKLTIMYDDKSDRYAPRTTIDSSSTVTFTLSSVPTTGQLDIDIVADAPDPEIRRNRDWSGGRNKIKDQLKDDDAFNKTVKKVIMEHLSAAHSVGEEIKAALNGQARFVFPGGGTFDVKDPMFNDVGDLMIGLTYRSGELT